MTTPTKPTLEEAANRNPAIAPDRVRQMQEVVKQLQERGVLKPSKYGIESGLTGAKGGLVSTQGTRMLNRVQSSG